MNMKNNDKIYVLSMILLISMNCAPITSDMQSAKTAGQGGIEISLSSGNVSMDSESSDDDIEMQVDGEVQSNSGGSFAYGITDNIDLRARYENIEITAMPSEVSFSMLSFGLKYGILEDKLALYVPYTMYNSDDDSTDAAKVISPALLYTSIFKEKYEITPSIKYILPVGDTADDNDPGLAYNLGFGYHITDKFTFRGEWGQYIPSDSEDNSTYSQTTFGLTYKIK